MATHLEQQINEFTFGARNAANKKQTRHLPLEPVLSLSPTPVHRHNYTAAASEMKAAFEWLFGQDQSRARLGEKTLTRHLKINTFDSQMDFQIHSLTENEKKEQRQTSRSKLWDMGSGIVTSQSATKCQCGSEASLTRLAAKSSTAARRCGDGQAGKSRDFLIRCKISRHHKVEVKSQRQQKHAQR